MESGFRFRLRWQSPSRTNVPCARKTTNTECLLFLLVVLQAIHCCSSLFVELCPWSPAEPIGACNWPERLISHFAREKPELLIFQRKPDVVCWLCQTVIFLEPDQLHGPNYRWNASGGTSRSGRVCLVIPAQQAKEREREREKQEKSNCCLCVVCARGHGSLH